MSCVSPGCGKPIPEERLAVKPDADRCVKHQSIDDQRVVITPTTHEGQAFRRPPTCTTITEEAALIPQIFTQTQASWTF